MYVLAVNYKAYRTAYGSLGLRISKEIDSIAKEYKGNVRVILLPPLTELNKVSSEVEVANVFAQHVDPVDEGPYTGYVTIDMIKEAGAVGVMVNHSERRLRLDEIYFILNKARKAGLEVLACADTAEVAAAISVLNPNMLAIEPPELIGTGIPVSKAKPEVVLKTLNLVRKYNDKITILTGAGITTGDDVKAAINLGTQGVLVASAVMKSVDPRKAFEDLIKAFVD